MSEIGILQQLSASLPVLRTKDRPIRRLLLSFNPAQRLVASANINVEKLTDGEARSTYSAHSFRGDSGTDHHGNRCSTTTARFHLAGNPRAESSLPETKWLVLQEGGTERDAGLFHHQGRHRQEWSIPDRPDHQRISAQKRLCSRTGQEHDRSNSGHKTREKMGSG